MKTNTHTPSPDHLKSNLSEAKAILRWITQVRRSISEPKTESEIAVEQTIEALYQRARREEDAAYRATLKTPDEDDFDS